MIREDVKKHWKVYFDMRVLYITNYPAPYRIDYFNELGKSCDLTVLLEESAKLQKHRKNEWFSNSPKNFKCVFLKEHWLFNRPISFEMYRYLNDKYDIIVLCNIPRVNIQLSILYCWYKRIPFGIEADGGFPDYSSSLKHIYKSFLIKKAKYYFASGNVTREYFESLGAQKDKIYLYQFSSLKRRELQNRKAEIADKTVLKQRLRIHESFVVITVGQFIHRKGFDVLLNAATHLDNNIGVYIIGDNPSEEYLSFREKNSLNNVHYVGFKPKEQLNDYYYCADIFVLPTREDIWGLVINEAMAYGLPVITTDKCIAGLELVSSDEGIIVQADNAEQITDAIEKLIKNEDMRLNMSEKAIAKIQSYSIEQMAESHLEAFATIMQETENKYGSC